MPEAAGRQVAFREHIRRSGVVATFTTPAELETEVLHALLELAAEQGHTRDPVPPMSNVLVIDSTQVQAGNDNVMYNNGIEQGARR
ncbi:MAG: hypothetical protein ACRDRH_19475 [Pseudonocardia sp.]